MRKSAVLVSSALMATIGIVPAAFARVHHHKAARMMVAPVNPRMDAMGQFYATPISATGIGVPGLEGVPGLGLATGVINGVAQPILAPGAAAPGLVIPGLDAAGNIVNGVTAPLLPPAS